MDFYAQALHTVSLRLPLDAAALRKPLVSVLCLSLCLSTSGSHLITTAQGHSQTLHPQTAYWVRLTPRAPAPSSWGGLLSTLHSRGDGAANPGWGGRRGGGGVCTAWKQNDTLPTLLTWFESYSGISKNFKGAFEIILYLLESFQKAGSLSVSWGEKRCLSHRTCKDEVSSRT